MKTTSLSSALVAALVGVAGIASLANAQSRMYLNADGLGQVLIYPYYTVNNNQATLVSVVNTTDQTKAVKVRFLEGRNSQEVLDFNLYLSPFDVWTGQITDLGNANGPGVLATTDTSCTVPDLVNRPAQGTTPAGSVDFRNFQYAANRKDDGPQGLDRTREGHFEIIEMGNVLNNGDAADRVIETSAGEPIARTLRSAIKHTAAGVPSNCAAVRGAWASTGVWTATGANVDMTPPSGGLFGGVSIVNGARGTNLSYNADAIDGFYRQQGTAASGLWNTLHVRPDSVNPSLVSAANRADGGVDSEVFINGQSVVMGFPAGREASAVSALFMYRNLLNEFVADAALGANSEWVVTFPTKRNHIDRATFVPGSTLATRNHTVLQALRPFTDWTDTTLDGRVYDTLGSCEPITLSFWNREEGPLTGPGEEVIDFSPLPPGSAPTAGPSLCYEAQVISFNQANTGEGATNTASQILGSRYARNLNTGVTAGWANIRLGVDTATDPNNLGNSRGNYLLDGPILASGQTKTGTRLFGLPATGFWALEVARLQGGSALANYSGTWRHRGSRAAGVYTETVSQNGFVPGCTTTIVDPNTGAQTVAACPNFRTLVTSGGSAL
jgi:hypothetical protein